MAGQWLAWNRACLTAVLEVAQIGITGRLDVEPTDKKAQQYLQPTEGIKIAASNLLSTLINFYGTFPTPTGPTSLSALQVEVRSRIRERERERERQRETERQTERQADERDGAMQEDVMQEFGLKESDKTVYMFNGNTISLLPFTRENGRTELVGVFRDAGGRYVWRMNVNYFVDEPTFLPPEKVTGPDALPENTYEPYAAHALSLSLLCTTRACGRRSPSRILCSLLRIHR